MTVSPKRGTAAFYRNRQGGSSWRMHTRRKNALLRPAKPESLDASVVFTCILTASTRNPGNSYMPTDVVGIANRIIANIEKVIIGKRPQLMLAVAAYFSEGHIPLEDVPGVAKTMLARA